MFSLYDELSCWLHLSTLSTKLIHLPCTHPCSHLVPSHCIFPPISLLLTLGPSGLRATILSLCMIAHLIQPEALPLLSFSLSPSLSNTHTLVLASTFIGIMYYPLILTLTIPITSLTLTLTLTIIWNQFSNLNLQTKSYPSNCPLNLLGPAKIYSCPNMINMSLLVRRICTLLPQHTHTECLLYTSYFLK